MVQSVDGQAVTSFGHIARIINDHPDQPLEVVARIYNVSDDGTFGQFLDGIDYSGLGEGDEGRLYGLRQMEGEFRTNISVTNTGGSPLDGLVDPVSLHQIECFQGACLWAKTEGLVRDDARVERSHEGES